MPYITRLAVPTSIMVIFAAACAPGTQSTPSIHVSPTGAPSVMPVTSVMVVATPSQTAAGSAAGTTSTAPPLVTHQSRQFKPAFSVQTPASWTFDGSMMSAGSLGGIVVLSNPIIASDANDCEGLAAPSGATTVDGIVDSLSQDARLATTEPERVEIGGFDGQAIDIELDPSWTATCQWSDGQPAGIILTAQHWPGPFFGLLGAERARIIVLDVGEDVVSIIVDTQDGTTFDSLVAAAAPVVESFEFTP